MKGYPSKSSAISRRSFLRTAGGVTFAIALSPALAFTVNSRTGTLANGQLSAWMEMARSPFIIRRRKWVRAQ